jgi:uncharacterized protein YkwD
MAFCCATTLAAGVYSQDFSSHPASSNTRRYANPVPPAEPEQQLEIQALDLINRDRTSQEVFEETKGRARPLQWDARLAAIARAHSEEMARAGYFGHQSLDGRNPAERASMAGIQWRAAGENIAKTESVAQAESEFMNEPKFAQNHRKNILSTEYTHVGIGIAKSPDGMIYITQDFAKLQ